MFFGCVVVVHSGHGNHIRMPPCPAANARIAILDVSGQAIDQFMFAPVDPNYGTKSWDLYSKNGIEVACWLYIYLVEYPGGSRWGTPRSCGKRERPEGQTLGPFCGHMLATSGPPPAVYYVPPTRFELVLQA
jgi:hypothetical protein